MKNRKIHILNKLWFRAAAALIVSAAIVLSVSNLFTGAKHAENTSTADFTVFLDSRVSDLMNYYNIPGAVIALVREGKTTWTGAYGYADLETGRRMSTDAVCRVESISKAVTAWGVMKLAEEGKLDLDAPVQQYLRNWDFPDSEFSEEAVTTRRLLSANAGMPLGPIGIRFSPEDENIPALQDRLSEHALLMQEPGTSFYYSNTGYWLLELLIEEITGQDFASYMETEVLRPLGMTSSSFTWHETFNSRIPNGYDSEGSPVPPYIYPDKAAGGLFATADDIASFLTAGMTGYSDRGRGVLKPESISALYTPAADTTGYYGIVFDSYGFGHFIETLGDGKEAVAVGGQGSGWMCHFHSIPGTGDGVVILTNSQNSWPFFGHLLRDWTSWLGLPAPGMSIINTGQVLMWIFIGLILAAVLWQLWRVVYDLSIGVRRVTPPFRELRFIRILHLAGFIVISTALLWVATRNYFFLSSVFPIASDWLWAVLGCSAAVLFVSFVFPRTKKSD